MAFATGPITVSQPPLADPQSRQIQSEELTHEVRANYIVSCADDFVVEVYQNGKAIPDGKRVLLNDRFGATTERINTVIHKVIGSYFMSSIIRSDGTGDYYFAVAGCISLVNLDS